MTHNPNTTTPADPATLTEMELFSQFLEGEVPLRRKRRKVQETTSVRDLLAGCGETEYFCAGMEDAVADLATDPDPTYALEQIMWTVEAIRNDVRLVHDELQRRKAERLIETGTSQFDEDTRYRAA